MKRWYGRVGIDDALALFDKTAGEAEADSTPTTACQNAWERPDEPVIGGVPGRGGSPEREDGTSEEVHRDERAGVPAPQALTSAPQVPGREVGDQEMRVVDRGYDDVVPADRRLIGAKGACDVFDGSDPESGLGVDQPPLKPFGPELSTAQEAVDSDLAFDLDGSVEGVPERSGKVVQGNRQEERKPAEQDDHGLTARATDCGE